MNKAERELLKRLGLAPDVLDAVREQLDQAVLQPANAGAALQPLPLCNNHLRPDEPRDSQAQNDTDAVHASVHSGESVRQKPPPSPAEIRKSRIIAMGMDMSQISSVVRTETVSPLDIFRRRRQLAEESGLFSVLFGEDTAKRANFGIIYGITVFGLAERLEISRDEAKQLIEGYFENFPKVKEYMDKSIQMARANGYAETLFHRRRYLADINSHNATVRGFAERNAINAPIQGTAADIIKVAMINVYRRFRKDGIKSKMILQVHDELNFSVLPEEKEKVEKIVLEEMQNALKMQVPLVADSGWGKNWLEAH